MKMMPPATFAPAYALHVALVVFAICSSSDAVVVTSVRSGSSSAVKKTSLLRAASTASMRALQAAVDAKDGDVSRFGPRGCISTWRNEDGHCQIATKCQARDLKDYPIKLLCKDGDGQMVRHVFPGGSFDPEEQFDTLIRCEQCMADTQNVAISDEAKSEDDSDDEEAQSDREQIGSVTEVSKNSRGERGSEATSESSSKSDGESLDRGPLNDLRDQVTELEGFMKKVDASEDDDSDDAPDEGELKDPEMIPAEIEGALLQRGGRQTDDIRSEMPRKRDGAFLQRGGHDDNVDMVHVEGDQDADGALNEEEGEDTEKSEDDDEMESDEDTPNSLEKDAESFDSAMDDEDAQSEKDEDEPLEDATDLLDHDEHESE
mmetsp:Transcript_45588/g.72098  ORF Transcript_45588/g.72098 Transcript_45588/m.72098 type:complete len:375 (-) Transcript_45588:58-1182(-)